MIVRSLKENAPRKLAKECVALLKKEGSVLLLPTETVYGLMCAYGDASAQKRIIEMKRREASKHFQILVSSLESLDGVAQIDDSAKRLVDTFCPGPLTIVVKSTGGLSTVGFRIPACKFMLELLKAFGRPLVATSANLSGNPPASTLDDALKDLASEPDLAVDAGEIEKGGTASTVVDLTGEKPRILRNGSIREAEILKALR
jgi:L-threonylcarbamoyladenylate synthase